MAVSMVRHPAVAGRFYPGEPQTLERDLDRYLGPPPLPGEKVRDAIGCLAPHAGYIYSGSVAGAVYRKLPARSRYIILCPNHSGRGEPLAMMSQGQWLTPLGAVTVDAELAKALHHACPLLTDDAVAHAGEHSLEVQIPFLQRTAETFTFVPIAISMGKFAVLESLGQGLAQALAALKERPLIIASSDMNHYDPDAITRLKDRKAVDKILALDPTGLYSVLQREDISMCGYGPAIAMLTAAKKLGATRAELVKYATSADTSGDRSAVVGYAGIIVD